MVDGFLHGVRTREQPAGVLPVPTVPAAIIGIIGTAPIQALADPDLATVGRPVLLTSDADTTPNFGPDVSGYTLPAALGDLYREGAGVVIAINVFDPAVHKTAVPGADRAIATGTVTLPHTHVRDVVVKAAGGAGATLILDTDYTLDAAAGTIAVLPGGALAAAAQAWVGYSRPDPTLVDGADLIGGVDEGGRRTGMQAFLDCYNLVGQEPQHLLAPEFSTAATVATALAAIGAKLRAFDLRTAPLGTTVQQAIEGRGPAGTINFNTSGARTVLCAPWVEAIDPSTGGTRLRPLDVLLAGAWARAIRDHGYWYGCSNWQLLSAVGLERPITAGIGDESTEANQLNAQGIVTVSALYGRGLRSWGNRSAAWPADSHPRTFLAVRLCADVIHKSLERVLINYLDQPLTVALAEYIIETGNLFIRDQVGRGALIDAQWLLERARNPVDQLALGILRPTLRMMPPPPLERIEIQSELDLTLLSALYQGFNA